jgi:hypothetical protein
MTVKKTAIKGGATRPRRDRERSRPRGSRRREPGQATPVREKRPKPALAEWVDREWKTRWTRIAAGRQAAT